LEIIHTFAEDDTLVGEVRVVDDLRKELGSCLTIICGVIFTTLILLFTFFESVLRLLVLNIRLINLNRHIKHDGVSNFDVINWFFGFHLLVWMLITDDSTVDHRTINFSCLLPREVRLVLLARGEPRKLMRNLAP
jgi:hypothetical protein